MLWRIPCGIVLVAITVLIHAVGLAVLLRAFLQSSARLPTHLGPIIWLLIRVTLWLLVIHLAEVAVWGLFYYWQGCLPDLESAFYFSGVTYATIGYGDLVLPQAWRMLAPVEGLMGILLCGLSAGIFFAVVNRVYAACLEKRQGPV